RARCLANAGSLCGPPAPSTLAENQEFVPEPLRDRQEHGRAPASRRMPRAESKFRARFVERVAEPLTRPVAAQVCIMAIARKRQLARRARLVVTHAAFLDVALAGLGIND